MGMMGKLKETREKVEATKKRLDSVSLKEASQDPKVRAIKMTLYRTSDDTKVVDYLIRAARNGKQVAVVVELKARFDEAANIRWATRMEEAGIHVTYGVIGLKTPRKILATCCDIRVVTARPDFPRK